MSLGKPIEELDKRWIFCVISAYDPLTDHLSLIKYLVEILGWNDQLLELAKLFPTS